MARFGNPVPKPPDRLRCLSRTAEPACAHTSDGHTETARRAGRQACIARPFLLTVRDHPWAGVSAQVSAQLRAQDSDWLPGRLGYRMAVMRPANEDLGKNLGAYSARWSRDLAVAFCDRCPASARHRYPPGWGAARCLSTGGAAQRIARSGSVGAPRWSALIRIGHGCSVAARS
jgi:hypothetical protein